jgi:class 3 adenylate cyclase
VAPAGLAAAQRLETITKLAGILSAPETEVEQLLTEGRLTGSLLLALQGKGVNITPPVKNSVQAMVRSLEAVKSSPVATPDPDLHFRSGATATIMFTDIVDSSITMQRLGDKEGRRLLSLHDEIIRHEVTAHEGQEVKSLGDGFMLSFRSVGRGLTCAVAIQQDLAVYNKKSPDSPLHVRMGLTVGEPVQDKEDLFGVSVITAARISAKAGAGQVLLSQVAYALASSGGEFEFRSVGTFELKGLDGRHEIYELLWDGK